MMATVCVDNCVSRAMSALAMAPWWRMACNTMRSLNWRIPVWLEPRIWRGSREKEGSAVKVIRYGPKLVEDHAFAEQGVSIRRGFTALHYQACILDLVIKSVALHRLHMVGGKAVLAQ